MCMLQSFLCYSFAKEKIGCCHGKMSRLLWTNYGLPPPSPPNYIILCFPSFMTRSMWFRREFGFPLNHSNRCQSVVCHLFWICFLLGDPENEWFPFGFPLGSQKASYPHKKQDPSSRQTQIWLKKTTLPLASAARAGRLRRWRLDQRPARHVMRTFSGVTKHL